MSSLREIKLTGLNMTELGHDPTELGLDTLDEL